MSFPFLRGPVYEIPEDTLGLRVPALLIQKIGQIHVGR